VARMENNIVPTIAPEEIHYVSKTIFSIARYYGGCQAYGHHYYVYDPLIDLDKWFEWFKGREIPCCIVKHKKMYSLWRAGEESCIPDWDQRIREVRKVEQITPEMEIVKGYRWPSVD